MKPRAAPVGRLAPSPTGRLHLGHARTFLIAWWNIRAKNGRIVMRIEDLDVPRVRPGMIEQALADIEWLGLDWDGEVLIQSSGAERFQRAIQSLVERGLAYACVCSRGDIRSAASAPQQGDAEVRYPGTCRGRFVSIEAAERETGRPAGLRFVVPEGQIEISDEFAGTHRFDVAREVGDFLIARRPPSPPVGDHEARGITKRVDRTPAYQLAVVVDDAFQGVTEILRGDDLLPSTARQRLLQDALGLSHPSTLHIPLVTDESGRRLAKRADDLSLAELRERGVDARAIVGWAAKSAGLEVAERIRPSEALPQFSLAKLPHQPVKLGQAELAKLLEAR